MALANPDLSAAQPAADAAAATPAAQPKVGTIVLLGTLTAIGAMSIDFYLPSLPAIGQELHADAATVQRTISAFFIGLAVSGLVYGPVSDRFGRRPALLFGVAVYVLASIECALAPTVDWLIAGRFAQAVGACAGQVVTRAIVRDRYRQQDTARIFSLLTLVFGVAPLIAPTIGAAIVTVASWRAIFAVMAVLSAVMGVAVATRLVESRSAATAAQASGESVLQAFGGLLRRRQLIGYLVASALSGATMFTYIASAPDVLITQFGLSPRSFAIAFGVIAAGIIGASQVNRGLLARYDSDRILAVASLVGVANGAGLILAAYFGQPWWFVAMLFVALTSFGFVSANAMAGALAIDPLRAGATSALISSASFAVGALAATVAGAFHDGTPRPMAIAMAVGLVGTALALHLLALPRRFAVA